MKNYKKALLSGFLTWLIPFVISFFFYSKDGVLLIHLATFKSIMYVTGIGSGMYLLVRYFQKEQGSLKEGFRLGLLWFGMNIALDLLVLIPMSHMPVSDYFTQIGLSYLGIIPLSMGAGVLAKK